MPGRKIAATVTRGAVGCSAWLGVRSDAVERWNKSLATLGLAKDDRVTGDGKLATTKRMARTKAQNRRPVEARGTMRDERAEKVVLAGFVAEPRGSCAALAADVGREACNGRNARHAKQTGERGGIG